MDYNAKPIIVKKDYADKLAQLMRHSAETLYQKYGIKRDERLFTETAVFDNGYQMDINVCTCTDSEPFADIVLYDNCGREICCILDDEETIIGEKEIFLGPDRYVAHVVCS